MGFYMVWGSFGVILGSLWGPMRWLTRPGRPSEPMHNERLLLWWWTDGRVDAIKIRSLGEFFDIKFWCYQKKKNRKKLQKLVLRFGTTGKKFGPKIFGGRPQVVVFSIPRDFVLEKFTKWSILPKITQNRAGARHRGSDPSDSPRRPQERYGGESGGSGPQ